MRIISLACKSCGAPLQIKEETDELCCARCGAQMCVDRGGGAVSLKLMEALGSIRTGAVQTAAELALVRLKEERINCLSGIGHMGRLESVESLCNETKKDLLSPSELASAQAQATVLKSKTETAGLLGLGPWVIGIEGVATLVAAVWLWQVTDGFFSILWAFIWRGALWLGAAWLLNMALMGAAVILTPNQGGALFELEGKLSRHQIHLQHLVELSRLTEAHAKLAQIDDEIARNEQIVRQR